MAGRARSRAHSWERAGAVSQEGGTGLCKLEAVLPSLRSSVLGKILMEMGLFSANTAPLGKNGPRPPSVRLEDKRLDFLPQTLLPGPALTPAGFNFLLCGCNFLGTSWKT